MTSTHQRAEQVLSEAQAVLSQVKHDLERSADFLRHNGIDPDKVLPALRPFMGPQQQQALQEQMREDQAAIDREVEEGMSHLRFTTPAPRVGKSPRRMV